MARRRDKVADQLRGKLPKLAAMMDQAESDVLAYMDFPPAHRTKLHSTNPLERLNGEIKRRTGVVGIFPNGCAAVAAHQRVERSPGPAEHPKQSRDGRCLSTSQLDVAQKNGGANRAAKFREETSKKADSTVTDRVAAVHNLAV